MIVVHFTPLTRLVKARKQVPINNLLWIQYKLVLKKTQP